MKYSEYFEIDKNYYPEINPDSVKNPGNEWQYTYPHETFVELLSSVELMLSRENTELRKGIWIEGSYGTGKSRVVWALKNLLECSEKEFRDYFEKNHDEFKKVPDLEDKLFAQRSGKIVTVFRYNSGEITTIKKFITAVFDSVSDALDNAGIAYNGNKTLRGKVVQWLSDDANKAYFNAIISMPQYRSLGSLSGKNADDIIAQLNNPSASSDALLTDILRIGEEKGIKPFNIEMQDLKDWLTDIIESNQLKAIVFLWDEFSSFFKNNPTALDVFQSLAELANDKPFYMVIVTHMAGSFFSDSDKRTKDAFNIVYDRFVHKTIEMPDNIAFRLIKHAMKIKDVAKDEYEDFADELTSYMPFSRKAVCEAVKVDDDVMKGIFPIHPMAALLLKHFAKNFASNQRSMFNFIKNSQSNDLHAFQWFIENHSPEDNEILTIDYLWDFFYEKGGDENSDTQGKSNLDIAIATILDTYPSNAAKLNREEQRVLKTVLMMQAISKKMNNGVELLRPTVQNLGLAFEGDDSMENNRAINIARNQLVQKKILYIDTNGSVEEFAASAIAGDQVQIDAIKDRLRKETKTAKLIDDGDLMSAFTFNSALRARYNFQYATVDNFKVTVNRINNMPKSYKFNAVKDNEHVRMLAKISVEVDVRTGQVSFTLPDFGLSTKETIIEDDVWFDYKEELISGHEVWGMIELGYRLPDDSVIPHIPGKIRLISFRNFCPYEINTEYYKTVRSKFDIKEWIDILLGAVDYNAAGYNSSEEKLTMLTRLLPFVEKRLNLIELAPKGTGKSYLFGRVSRYGWLSSGGVMSRAKMFYDISKRTEGLVSGNDFITLDEVQTISFTDVDEMRAALKGYLESGVFTVGNYEGTASSGVILCGNISKETMDNDGTTDMFCELPAVFHESALIERFHGFIKGWNIPRMNDDLKISGWALNSEYFCSILHELRDDTTYRSIVDALVVVPAGADTRDTEAVKRIATAYLKLLFPNVKKPEDIDSRDFNRYCLRRACNMRATIKMQLGIMDSEYRGKDIPAFKVAEIN